MNAPLKLAVLVSGSGRSLQNLIDLSGRGELPAQIRIVVSSDPDAVAVERAKRAGISIAVVQRREFSSATAFSDAVTRALEPSEPDLIVMAGYLQLYRFPKKYAGRVINVHPALLPEFGGQGFYGRRVHEAVIAAGAKESGCTVHFADLEYDHGPIILQRRVPVRPEDTPESLADRVFQEELIALPEAIRRFAAGKRAAAPATK